MPFLNLPVDISKLKQIKAEGGYQIVIEVDQRESGAKFKQQLLEEQGTTELLHPSPCPQVQESWLWKHRLSLKSS